MNVFCSDSTTQNTLKTFYKVFLIVHFSLPLLSPLLSPPSLSLSLCFDGMWIISGLRFWTWSLAVDIEVVGSRNVYEYQVSRTENKIDFLTSLFKL